MTAAEKITATCRRVEKMLLDKNAAYGDSAFNPVRIFSKADAEEQIKVRLDDKLSRLARGNAAGEDVVLDLVGYLILLLATREPDADAVRDFFTSDALCGWVTKGPGIANGLARFCNFPLGHEGMHTHELVGARRD